MIPTFHKSGIQVSFFTPFHFSPIPQSPQSKEPKLLVLYSPFIFFIECIFSFIYFRERVCLGGGTDGEDENLKQSPHWAQNLMWGSISPPRDMTWAKTDHRPKYNIKHQKISERKPRRFCDLELDKYFLDTKRKTWSKKEIDELYFQIKI